MEKRGKIYSFSSGNIRMYLSLTDCPKYEPCANVPSQSQLAQKIDYQWLPSDALVAFSEARSRIF